jgi:HAAS domain-containing protein
MSANPSSPGDPVSAYIHRVAVGLKGIDEAQKQEIVAEIRSHLAERVEQFASEGSRTPAEAAVAAMGDATTLANQFMGEVRQKRASRSFAPWVLLRAAARVALTGVKGLLAFLVGVIGYSAALGFTLCAVMKPIMPSKVGFWVGSNFVVWGVPQSRSGGYELAGHYFIPLSLIFAFLFGSGTTLLLRWIIGGSIRSTWDRAN